MTEPIFAAVEHDLLRGFDAFRSHLPHRHYHDPGTAATPATEAPMSLLTSVENEIHALADHARKIEQEVLPAAASDAARAEQLLSSPLAGLVLSTLHVPADELLKAVGPILDFFARAYAPEAAAQAPAVADPAMGETAAPEPAPATA